MQGTSSVAIGGTADIALASEAGGSDQKDSMLRWAHSQETGRGRPSSIQNDSGLTQGPADRPVTG